MSEVSDNLHNSHAPQNASFSCNRSLGSRGRDTLQHVSVKPRGTGGSNPEVDERR
jgi:hypothetical protein